MSLMSLSHFCLYTSTHSQLNPTEPQPVPAFLPAHLNNKPICDDIIRKFSPSRRLESRELAKLLAQPHFRVSPLKLRSSFL